MIALKLLNYLARSGRYRGTIEKEERDKIIFKNGTEVTIDAPNSLTIKSNRADVEIILKEVDDGQLRDIARKIYGLIRVLSDLKRRIRSFLYTKIKSHL